MIRYGKPSGPLLAHKQAFFRENESLLAERRRIDDLYVLQPRRATCKNCDAPLGPPTFRKRHVDFHLCTRCGHLTGGHEDTDAFCAALYTENGGGAYAKTYSAADRAAYHQRVEDIYLPKADFLLDGLVEQGERPGELGFADLGAGSGHFVAALRHRQMQATGYEVSQVQVELGNMMTSSTLLIQQPLDATEDLARTLEVEVISLIGVLEHLRHPRAMLAALRANPRLRYLFISVPVFSPTVFLELVFPEVFARQLSGAHTHLYTDSSLSYLCQEFGMTRAAEWWFGTDLVDLYRSVAVELERSSDTRGALPAWRDMLLPALDDAQLALDRRHLASEVHLLLRFR